MTQTVALIFAGLGVLAALFFNFRARASAGEASKAWAENEKLAGDLKAVREQLGKQSGKLAGHDEEVVALRKRLDKAKRRSGAAPSGNEGVPASQLELEAELEEARQARDGARSEAEALAAEVSRLRAKLAPKPEPEPEENPTPETTELEELRAAGTQAAADLAKSQEAQEELRRAKARLKKKIDTQELLYVAIRTELEAKKDRLRGQQELIERLQALEVSLGSARTPSTRSEDPSPPETGGEAEAETAPDLPVEPGTEPASDPSSELTPEPASEPSSEITPEPTSELISEPIPEPVE